MGYRMFGYNDAGPAAQQMGGLNNSVREWSKKQGGPTLPVNDSWKAIYLASLLARGN